MYTLLCLTKFTYFSTYSLEKSPSWEVNLFSASQEIPQIMWKQKGHYHIHVCPSNVPLPSKIDPVQSPTFHFLRNETKSINERLWSNTNNIRSSIIRTLSLLKIKIIFDIVT